jgi:hypothetical protein
MQKVIIIIIAAILSIVSINTINAQVANNTSEPTTTQVTKHDTLIVSNPNTVILYQGANIPVVYAQQPNAKQLVPREIQPTKSQNAGARTGKIISSTMIGGLTGMVLGGAIAYNRALQGDVVDVFFSPITTLAGAATGGLIGTGTGLCLGFALSK